MKIFDSCIGNSKMKSSRTASWLSLITLILGAVPALLASNDSLIDPGDYLCKSLPEAIELLRSSGARVAYSEGLVSERMLIRRTPSASSTQDLLAEIVRDYGLEVQELGGRTLSIVPAADLEIERHRRITSPLLAREDIYDAIPEWRGRDAFGSSVVELDYIEGQNSSMAIALSDNVDFILWRLPQSITDANRAAFELKRQIVAVASKTPGARVGLDGSAEVIEALLDEELSPYIDGYVFRDTPWVPELDPTGRPWWRTSLGQSTLLDQLLEGTARGAALVLLDDAAPAPTEIGLLEAIRAAGGGFLDPQPKSRHSNSLTTRIFMEPRTGNFLVSIYSQDSGERVHLDLEPDLEARVIYPAGAKVAADSYGRFVDLQLEGAHPHWLIELEKSHDLPRYGASLVEDEVIIDPYEVVVRNQIFQKAERDKLLSLDVVEYASITPSWRDGTRSFWKHRIFHRRGRLDEYLHLEVYRDGVKVPRNKMYKSILGRPVERIELAPLSLENRKTYSYEYLGTDEIDGHPTWKIGFEPVLAGRLVRGVIWIDQVTGAHRQIRAHHQNLGVGILSGTYTTRYRWIPGPEGCHWDWDRRNGTETYDYLDFEGVSQIDYERTDFRFNRADIEQEIQRWHESDVLIHVATPPNGHRWLLRGEEVKEQRGDLPYSDGLLREKDDPANTSEEDAPATNLEASVIDDDDAAGGTTASLGPSLERREGDALNEALAGPWAFPSRSRVNVGYFGGTGNIDSNVELGFNFLNWDLFRRARKGKDPFYLWIGGFGDDGLISFTDPHLLGSKWSLTGSLDLQFDPEEDFLFRQSTPTPGDESTINDLSLDSEEASIRLSLGRPLTQSVSMRIKLGATGATYNRKAGTDPSFVLPRDTDEYSLRTELSVSRRSGTLVVGIESGKRTDWQAWGLNGRQEALDQWGRYDARATYTHPLGRSQTVNASLGLFGGWDQDRFSRRRLFEVDARVPGYSSSIGFDEGVHASLSYNFRIWKLPLRLRTDFADVSYDTRDFQNELVDRTLLGAQLNLSLHGPLETDLLFGVGRGFHSEPALQEETSYWLIVSRRFGNN